MGKISEENARSAFLYVEGWAEKKKKGEEEKKFMHIVETISTRYLSSRKLGVA